MSNANFETDIILQIRHLSRCIKKDFDDRLEQFGLTSQQGRILYFVYARKENNELTHQQDIEERFNCSKSSISEIVTRLVKGEFLKKEKDGQFYSIEPAQKGSAVVQDFLKHRNETMEKLLKGFSKQDVDNMLANLNKLIENIKEVE